MRGFSKNWYYKFTTNSIAKLWVDRYGLNLVWLLGHKYIVLKVGLKLVINWLTTYSALTHDISILVCD